MSNEIKVAKRENSDFSNTETFPSTGILFTYQSLLYLSIDGIRL